MTPVKRLAYCLGMLALFGAVGCQQKLADQPAPRTYEANSFFPNKQSARPIEPGTVYVGQLPPTDPMLNWLTPTGRKPAIDIKVSGDASYDAKSAVPPIGAPYKDQRTLKGDEKLFVEEIPFTMTESDLVRGQSQYNVYCAECHGAAGNGAGKIVERGYLRPPSYHADPDEIAMDWSTLGESSTELKRGHSRGYWRYKILVPLEEAPIGYIYQVITWGYGGMPEKASQVLPIDRWRIAAYIRALQLSQGASLAKLPETDRKTAEEMLSKKPAATEHTTTK